MLFKRYQLELRSWEEIKQHVIFEAMIALKDWKILLYGLAWQYIHSIFHNLAYWIQGRLTIEQRTPLYDLGYNLLPEFTDAQASISEILVFGFIFAPSVLLVCTVPFIKPVANGNVRYVAVIVKRFLFHTSICLFFRCVSFLVTALPGAAPHCRPLYNQTCLDSNPINSLECVIPNPDFQPPTTTSYFFFHINALDGCGDLMFSSHTMYTMSFILAVFKYWKSVSLLIVMLCIQIAIAFCIVAARKHYTLDVVSALYIVPMIWFLQDAYFHDINHKDEGVTPNNIVKFYNMKMPQADLNSIQLLEEGTDHSPIVIIRHALPTYVLLLQQQPIQLLTLLRSWKELQEHVLFEIKLALTDWKVLLYGLVWQCNAEMVRQNIHSVLHNLAYWIQGRLSDEQRTPLYDVGFNLLPEFTESQASISEILVFGFIFAPSILLVCTVPFLKPKAGGQPLFLAIIVKRFLFHTAICLMLRCISFLVTALPGAAPHCRPLYNQTCLDSNPVNSLECVIPNPDFQPPTTTSYFFFHIDALNGCGDLMFSSHTMYTMSFILTLYKYWKSIPLLIFMLCVQIAIAFCIVAARKHYTLDVISALYIIPMAWFLQDAYFHDINHKDEGVNPDNIKKYYNMTMPDQDNNRVLVENMEEGSSEQTPSHSPSNNITAPFDGPKEATAT
ncbi:hypothetical protein THRCLA_07145 [Thraustotheca clavata]|uniref:Sphingomyelin synthase-like domain-containing protein n=1 Tax=Thraustotheca clavata TaxID=74557 RepID=A0A1V9ZFZ6_9STRA|nr:hypothetical protein THRCLA_07145 [Thraustotheca clavata]